MGEVYGAVDWVHDPTIFCVCIAGITFFTEQCDFGERLVQFFFNQLLATDIEFELDVVKGDFIGLLFGGQVFPHDGAGGMCGFHGSLLCVFQIHKDVMPAATVRVEFFHANVLRIANYWCGRRHRDRIG